MHAPKRPRTFADVPTCYPEGCAATSFVPCQRNTRGSLSKLEGDPPQRKITVTSKSPVGDISVVTLIRTDTTLDHSQKAEKVCTDAIAAIQLAQSADDRACSTSSVRSTSCRPPRGSLLIRAVAALEPCLDYAGPLRQVCRGRVLRGLQSLCVDAVRACVCVCV